MNIDFIIRDCLPWGLSAMTIWMTVLQGKKNAFGWIVGLCNQVGWLVWQLYTHTWGLLPLNAMLWVLYTRNFIKWRKEERQFFMPVGKKQYVAFKELVHKNTCVAPMYQADGMPQWWKYCNCGAVPKEWTA